MGQPHAPWSAIVTTPTATATTYAATPTATNTACAHAGAAAPTTAATACFVVAIAWHGRGSGQTRR